jgi:energy-coupling factor transport system substrate-specific component
MYIPYFFINSGWEMYFAMWVNGIPFDLVHCGGNFVLTLVLYKPLHTLLRQLVEKS